MSAQNKQPLVSLSAVAAAGLASATAAAITSRFGVAGTLIGAALTTMIITGGSAILKAYLESITGRVRRVPGKVRERASREKQPRDGSQPPVSGETLPGRADLRNNPVGRMRAALDWFRNLSPLRRRSIIAGALVPAILAFVIAMGAITSVELVAGRSLSCLWNDCAAEAAGVPPRTTLGSFTGIPGVVDPATQDPAIQEQPGVAPGQDGQPAPPDPSAQPSDPAAPADPGAQPPAQPAPEQPAQPAPAEPQAEPPVAPEE